MSKRIVFKRNVTIGAPDAEQDDKFLSECFVNTGDLTALRDPKENKRIILGRTGSGKTALLNRLTIEEENTINIPPENLSLTYLSNSSVLQFFTEAGVELDIFYKLLWRHVFAVELIKAKYKINNEKTKNSFINRLKSMFTSDKKKSDAIDYWLKWGETFWEDTEYRIREVTTNLEKGLTASVKGVLPQASMGIEGARKLTEEQKIDVVHKGQSVVNKVQIRQLSEVMQFLTDDIFTDPKQKYFIVIDQLDENWIEDRLRYRLIRALIETVKDFKKVVNVKIIVAIRTDLIERVFRLTRSSGFQEEKYESLFVYLSWDKKGLIQVLDKRINHLLKSRYTTEFITHSDILPRGKINKTKPIDYILERTMMRPRDVIMFINTCLRYAEGKATINKAILSKAEGEFSKNRLRALADEWYGDYPDLADFALVLKKTPKGFLLKNFNNELLDKFSMDQAIRTGQESEGIIGIYTKGFLNPRNDISDFKRMLFGIFYRVGLIGIKLETFTDVSWAYEKLRPTISSSEITEEIRIYIHPFAWRILGTSTR